MHKEEYHKVKKYEKDNCSVYLEARIKPNWASVTDKKIYFNEIYYKVTYKSRGKGKVVIELTIYGAEFYHVRINSMRCHFHDSLQNKESALIHVDGMKEFFEYLEKFDEDVLFRLVGVYKDFGDKMPKKCKEIMEEIINKI